MTPSSNVIQLVTWVEGFIAVCADGSVWFFKPGMPILWTLITHMDKGKYV